MFFKICLYSMFVVILSILIKQFTTVFYYDHKLEYTYENSEINSLFEEKVKDKLFTINELEKFDGSHDFDNIYISILGHVFDVSKGKQHYGPGNTYHFFAGCDASRSFVTGDFNKVSDDIINLSPNEIKSIFDWKEFYLKNYNLKGKLIGRYFNNNGEPTEYSIQVQNILDKLIKLKDNENKSKMMYPSCNIEWNAEKGTRVWCSTKSGGIERDWIGVPRKLFEPGLKSYRCACVETEDINKKNILEYENCHKKASSCYIHL